MKQKILMTGSTGGFGSIITPYLKNLYEVVELEGNILEPENIRHFFKNIDWVIHLAGKVEPTRRPLESYFTTNVIGTENVARLCLENGCRLLNFTTDGAFVKASEYGTSKRLAEEVVEHFTTKGLRAVSLRVGRVSEESCFLDKLRKNACSVKELNKTIAKIVEQPISKYKAYTMESWYRTAYKLLRGFK